MKFEYSIFSIVEAKKRVSFRLKLLYIRKEATFVNYYVHHSITRLR